MGEPVPPHKPPRPWKELLPGCPRKVAAQAGEDDSESLHELAQLPQALHFRGPQGRVAVKDLLDDVVDVLKTRGEKRLVFRAWEAVPPRQGASSAQCSAEAR